MALEDIDLFTRSVFTKHSSWAYEQEWRLFFGSGRQPEQDREYEEFDPDDLEAVILGSRMAADIVGRVTELVSSKYGRATVKTINRSSTGAYIIEDAGQTGTL